MGVWRPQLGKWRNFPERDALLLFAQSIVELLFHHTADSFRAHVLNLHGLVRESCTIVREVVKGTIPVGAMEPLIEELVHRIGVAPAFGNSRPALLSQYQSALGNKKRREPRELELTLNALRAELETSFWPLICTAIKEEIRSCKPTQRIIDLADAFIGEAELRGWDRQAIYSKTRWYFFQSRYEPDAIESVSALDDFISYFESADETEFVCVFRAEESIEIARETLSKAYIDVYDSTPAKVPVDARSTKFLSSDSSLPKYIFIRNVKALDGVSARKAAEHRLQFIINMCRFREHAYRPIWSEAALVYDASSMERYLIQKPNSPMLVGNVYLSEISVDDLVSMFRDRRLSPNSSSVLFSVLEYHRSAIDAPTSENQLLNLWAGVEGMMPPPYGDKAHVLHFADYIVPSLTLVYIERHIQYIADSLELLDRTVIDYVRQHGVGASDFMKCASLLCCSDLQQERSGLVSLLNASPLLRLRVESVINKVSTPAALKAVLECRQKWIRWQIQRIYSLRNRIVHDAQTMHYLDSIVENLHSYFDTLVCAVIRFSLNRGSVNSVDSVLQALRVHESSYLESLNTKDPFHTSTYARLLFGVDNPLAP